MVCGGNAHSGTDIGIRKVSATYLRATTRLCVYIKDNAVLRSNNYNSITLSSLLTILRSRHRRRARLSRLPVGNYCFY